MSPSSAVIRELREEIQVLQEYLDTANEQIQVKLLVLEKPQFYKQPNFKIKHLKLFL